jgi:uracil-DNA glycosylase
VQLFTFKEFKLYYPLTIKDAKNMMTFLNTKVIAPSWRPIIREALKQIPSVYWQELAQSTTWLPGPDKVFNAFSQPIEQIKYILLGESPYPRQRSANGYAFWDAAVKTIWSDKGLSKEVNRATSLRNIVKMLLLADKRLDKKHLTQDAIAKLDKQDLVLTNDQFFNNLINHGFLLLNASLVLQPGKPKNYDAKIWFPFICYVLQELLKQKPDVVFILLGTFANKITEAIAHKKLKMLTAEHPYNISFITNPDVINFFQPLKLLQAQ